MKRFILNNESVRNGIVRLSGADYHYLVRVRRLAAGEFFPAALPAGEQVLIRIDSVDGGVLSGAVVPENITEDSASPERPRQGSGSPPLILFQAMPKGDKMDLIVRQAAEAGLAEIVPFVSEYSVQQRKTRGKPVGSGPGEVKTARWRRIVKEARQQSGSVVDTVVRAPVSAHEALKYWEQLKAQYPDALGLALHQIPLEQGSLHGYLDKRPGLIAAAIGPEGGFSPSEVSGFLDAGFKPLTIGNTVLRTETAAVFASAAIQIILQERDSWEMSRKN